MRASTITTPMPVSKRDEAGARRGEGQQGCFVHGFQVNPWLALVSGGCGSRMCLTLERGVYAASPFSWRACQNIPSLAKVRTLKRRKRRAPNAPGSSRTRNTSGLAEPRSGPAGWRRKIFENCCGVFSFLCYIPAPSDGGCGMARRGNSDLKFDTSKQF